MTVVPAVTDRRAGLRGGRAPRAKGNRFERAIVKFFRIKASRPSACRCRDRPAVRISAISACRFLVSIALLRSNTAAPGFAKFTNGWPTATS